MTNTKHRLMGHETHRMTHDGSFTEISSSEADDMGEEQSLRRYDVPFRDESGWYAVEVYSQEGSNCNSTYTLQITE